MEIWKITRQINCVTGRYFSLKLSSENFIRKLPSTAYVSFDTESNRLIVGKGKSRREISLFVNSGRDTQPSDGETWIRSDFIKDKEYLFKMQQRAWDAANEMDRKNREIFLELGISSKNDGFIDDVHDVLFEQDGKWLTIDLTDMTSQKNITLKAREATQEDYEEWMRTDKSFWDRRRHAVVPVEDHFKIIRAFRQRKSSYRARRFSGLCREILTRAIAEDLEISDVYSQKITNFEFVRYEMHNHIWLWKPMWSSADKHVTRYDVVVECQAVIDRIEKKPL